MSPLISIVDGVGILAPKNKESANDLGRRYCEWIRDRLMARDDAFVSYDQDGQPWKRQPLTPQSIIRHSLGIEPICLYAISLANQSKWVAWDLDNHEDDGETGLRNTDYVLHLEDRLRSYFGLEPLVEASDGRGGYHVWILFDDFLASAIAHRFAQWVVEEFCDWRKFLKQPPEVFPKQALLTETTRYGSSLRIPGRHPTRDWRSSILARDGGHWISWPDAVAEIVSYVGDSVSLIPAEAREVRLPQARTTNKQNHLSPDIVPNDRLVTSVSEYFDFMRTWESILEPHGWDIVQVGGHVTYWRRPDKHEPGHSATTGYCGHKLFVFSHNARPFEAGRAYTKFQAFTLLEHDGDSDAAEGDIFSNLFNGESL